MLLVPDLLPTNGKHTAAVSGKNSFPLVIAGAGPAGLSAAITVAQRGLLVCLLEPSIVPAEKTGEVVSPGIEPLLERLEMQVVFQNNDHLPCYGFRFRWGNETPAEKLFITDRRGNGWQLDRPLFEKQLRERALALGVDIRLGQRIRQVQRIANGWEIETEGENAASSLQSAFLADATGRSGTIARRVGAKRMQFDKLIGVSGMFQLKPGVVFKHYTQVEATANGWWYAVEIPGNRLRAVYMTDADLLDKSMQQSEKFQAHFEQTMTAKETFSSREKICGEPVTVSASTSALEIPYGDAWLALGDAAYAFDPVSSYGISSALGSGFYAGNAIADALNGNPDALPAYRYVMENTFQQYLEMWREQYRYEQRWPESEFWKRRH